MSCNQETLQCKHDRFTILPECCKDNLKEILKAIDEIFTEHKIAYWLDYGTLLGAVREGDIIKTDDDIDIGIMRHDAEKLLSLGRYFLKKNMYIMPLFYPDFVRIDFSRTNALHVDIFIWDLTIAPFKYLWEKENCLKEKIVFTRQEYHYEDNNKGRDFPPEILFPRSRIKLGDREYPCPVCPEKFVKFRYGQDWKTPKNI